MVAAKFQRSITSCCHEDAGKTSVCISQIHALWLRTSYHQCQTTSVVYCKSNRRDSM
uniref:Uncharacterized protein n=1 Tax=Anguilla anguilla TaxID=7936 RepID=A0A0E9Q0Z0_ANGAN